MISPETSIKDLIEFLNKQIEEIDNKNDTYEIQEDVIGSTSNNPNYNLKISNEELVLLSLLFNKFKRILGINFINHADSLLNQVLIKSCKWNVKNFTLSTSFVTKNTSNNKLHPHFTFLCESVDYSQNDYSKFASLSIGIDYFKENRRLINLDIYKSNLNTSPPNTNLNLDKEELI